jgi:ribosome biogenesis GTPase A
VVDLFDFNGSLMPDLADMVGRDSPLMMVANKVDLLPKGTNLRAVDRWVRLKCREAGLPPLASLDLVSCRSGTGLRTLLSRVEETMKDHSMDAYVVGAANAGKSSFLNAIVAQASLRSSHNREGGGRGGDGGGRGGWGNRGHGARLKPTSHTDGSLTTSHLPGTTLDFVKAAILDGPGHALYDTPGIIMPNQLTNLLLPEELAAVVPKKRADPVTLRMGKGKSILVGGLARLELVSGDPSFLFTFYLANAVALHPTATTKVNAVLSQHVGGLITPPWSTDRLGELFAAEPVDGGNDGEAGGNNVERADGTGNSISKDTAVSWEGNPQEFHIHGAGWNEPAVDLVLPGLGWVAVTGADDCIVRVTVPHPIRVELRRDPLLPDDSARNYVVKNTGGKLVTKRGRTKRRR